MTPRLLFLVNDAGFFLSHFLPFAQAAQGAGFDVHVAVPGDGATPRITAAGLTVHDIPLSRRGTSPLAELRSLLAITRLYRRLRPDITHHITSKPVIYGGIASRLAGIPATVSGVTGLGHVFVTPGLRAAILKAVVRAGYRLALRGPRRRVIFENPDDRDVFVAEGLIDATQALVIRGAGVDMAEFAPTPEPPAPVVVVLAARLLREKGVEEFVAAARALHDRGVEARFALVGDSDPGNPSAVPPETLQTYAASGAVEWWGRRNDMPAVFAEAHIVCLPSYREGLPKVLIEAAACGRPIVTTDVPGCRVIVHDGENGLLVPARDAPALAEALATLIADPAMRQRMGRRGREQVESEYALSRILGVIVQVYREALGATPSTP